MMFFSLTTYFQAACDPAYFTHHVLPQLESQKGVTYLHFICDTPMDQLTRAVEAARPKAVSVSDYQIDLTHSCLQNIKHLLVAVHEVKVESYLRDSALKVFSLGMNRQKLGIVFYRPQYPQLLEKFIMAWIRGQSIGSLKKFIFYARNQNSDDELHLFTAHLERIVKENKKELESKYWKMPNGKYSFQRATSESMELKITPEYYMFRFF